MAHHPVGPRARPINLIDHHNRTQALGKGFAGDKSGLGHRAFNCIHQEQHAIDHREDPLHLTAKISMARGVDDVDVRAFVINCTVFGQDRNSALTLQVIGIHHPFSHLLMPGKRACLLKQFINQGGFAMIDVGDDGDIA